MENFELNGKTYKYVDDNSLDCPNCALYEQCVDTPFTETNLPICCPQVDGECKFFIFEEVN